MKSIFGTAANEDKTLIILTDLGYDTGDFSHIKTSLGMVDIRTLTSKINLKDGYQRELEAKRVKDIIQNFHIAKFDPITICLGETEDGERNVLDGQCRVNVWNTLFRTERIDNPMIPCKILRNTKVKDEAYLFGTQDSGKTPLKEKDITKSMIVAEDKETVELNNIITKYGMNLGVGGETKKRINAHATIKKCRKQTTLEVFDRIMFVISKAWCQGEIKNSTSEDILKGLTCMYTYFADEIDDKSFIEKLKRTSPDTIRDDFKIYSTKSDANRKYLKTLVMIYNKNRKINRIDYV